MPTIIDAVQDSGVIDVPLEDGEQGDDNPTETQDGCGSDSRSQTGESGIPTNVSAMKGNGAILEEGEQGYCNPTELKCNSRADSHQNKVEKEKLNNAATVQQNGPVDLTLEDGKQIDGKPMEFGHDHCQEAVYSANKCHQGTQTEFSAIFSIADVVDHEKVKATHF